MSYLFINTADLKWVHLMGVLKNVTLSELLNAYREVTKLWLAFPSCYRLVTTTNRLLGYGEDDIQLN